MKPILLISLFLFLSGCTVVEVVDQWKNMDHNSWEKDKPVSIPVVISDTGFYYDLAVNLRVTNDYKYSNLWLKLFVTDPEGKSSEEPVMLTLADHRGEWKGHNLGHIISFRLPVKKDQVYHKPGKYIFKLQQYMRDPILKEIVSVGVKLDKEQEILK